MAYQDDPIIKNCLRVIAIGVAFAVLLFIAGMIIGIFQIIFK